MGVYLLANNDSDSTTVSVEEVRKFVEDVAEVNSSLKTARGELADALDGDDKIDELKDSIKSAREALKSYIENHSVYKEYSAEIERLKEDRKDLIAEGKTAGIPKKEVDTAIKMLKSDIDPESTSAIYSEIADLVD